MATHFHIQKYKWSVYIKNLHYFKNLKIVFKTVKRNPNV